MRSWVKSSALCSLQKNSVGGDAELITAIRWQSVAQQGMGGEPVFCVIVVVAVVTVFDWRGIAQSTWKPGCVYEMCACNDERGSLSYDMNAQSELLNATALIVCMLDSD